MRLLLKDLPYGALEGLMSFDVEAFDFCLLPESKPEWLLVAESRRQNRSLAIESAKGSPLSVK